ncbi:YtxH domain-containing protein [Paenibacillus arenilitoris]|uniref:YtxH domain-containing protein n=1 Tax=Paenibacillus arenilitoris TaxID=2772299 RepID=A0A927CLE8_9BACL|nr:YtxH domain-containing protein [Paenibacillus arenilitoris]MBD2868016.1 YtxH domain-containing protein [Paenibacillus arenilitoris]
MAKEQTGSGVVLGAIIGGAVGAVSALLLAPKSGAELREDISGKWQSVSQKTKEMASAVGRQTKTLASKIGDEASDLAGQAKKSNENVMDALTAAKDEVKEEAQASR